MADQQRQVQRLRHRLSVDHGGGNRRAGSHQSSSANLIEINATAAGNRSHERTTKRKDCLDVIFPTEDWRAEQRTSRSI